MQTFEGIERSLMLQSLFDEMMSTSQIQKMLGKIAKNGRVDSQVLGARVSTPLEG